MPRFFLPDAPEPGGTVELTGEAAAHARVLRLRPGDGVVLCDGRGRDFTCAVAGADGGRLTLTVLDAAPSRGEPALQATVYMAFPKADKLEHVLQKATELGAAEIVAFPSVRCVARPDGKSLPKKLERWQRIAASAAEQSGRGRIPAVRAAASFAQAMEEAARKDLAAFLYEGERTRTFRSLMTGSRPATAALVSGPEGGFAPEEAEAAAAAGLVPCTLGPRILRCETAPLCALSALMFAWGELD